MEEPMNQPMNEVDNLEGLGQPVQPSMPMSPPMPMEQSPMMPMEQMPQQSMDASSIQAEIDSLSMEEKENAKQAMLQIVQVIEQLKAQGASDEEIEAFLAELGITLEELQFAEQLLLSEDNLGLNI
tara:strand:- start:550 stop:927 length:378 start_codon:yes stop_codon:yes gene_type:complete